MKQFWMFIGIFESSCTKIMMRGPIVNQLCGGRNRETNKLLVINFTGFFVSYFLRYRFITLVT